MTLSCTAFPNHLFFLSEPAPHVPLQKTLKNLDIRNAIKHKNMTAYHKLSRNSK